jgi:hypothetical protein
MKLLPYSLAIAHALFVAVVFGSAISYPQRASLLPLFVYGADMPVSLVIERLSNALAPRYEGILLIECIAYLIIGSLWYFLLGYLLKAFFWGIRSGKI